MSASSFVDVRHVFVDYAPPTGLLSRISGKETPARSVLRDITFQLRADEHVTLFGVSGSGKSTLLRALAGVLSPSRGHITINGKPATQIKDLASGYISIEESEPEKETVAQILHAFAKTHSISSAPARIGVVAEKLNLNSFFDRTAISLSTTERLRLNLARAALGSSPLVLLDDVTDQLGASVVSGLLRDLFPGRAVISAVRSVTEAEQLKLPIMLLHNGTLAHFGTCDAIGSSTGCPRVVNVWVEGLRYDLLRALKHQPGVLEARLVPTDQFEGQRLRVTVRSTRYLPSFYDLISQASLIRIEEEPVSLEEIVASLK